MNIFDYSKKITEDIKEIINPYDLLQECNKLAIENGNLIKSIFGYSSKNNPIEVYEIGKGKNNVLIYGFPDPSEAIGGTSILALIKELLRDNNQLISYDIRWIFIPCLNFDDQPDNGKNLKKVMKTKSQEVDWCLNQPREETKALLKIAEKYKPIISLPLHDEFHCEENIPIYFPVMPELDIELCNKLRDCISYYNLEIDKSYNDIKMGYGFFEMSKIAPDFYNSTFSILSKYGNVIIFELSDIKSLNRNLLCEIQISIMLEIFRSLLI
jgi:hypothetical protein